MAGLFNSYYYGKAGKADFTVENLPKNRRELFFQTLRVRFSGIISVNLLFLVFCLPAIVWTGFNLLAILAASGLMAETAEGAEAALDASALQNTAGMLTTYRNTKNFDVNFVSSAYGIHFYRSSAMYHRPRQRLGTCTHIAGTGYVLRSRLLKGGWHYTSLTEDAELTQYMAARGEKIIFCEAAEFFDEQPHSFKVMFRQRLR